MPRRLLPVLVILTAVYRFSLLGHGALAFVDETLYFTSVKALQSLAAGGVRGAIADISVARGRDGAAVLQLPVAALQAIPAHYGVPASNLTSLLIPTACNVIVSLLSLVFVFRIGVVLSGKSRPRWRVRPCTRCWSTRTSICGISCRMTGRCVPACSRSGSR